MDGSAHTHFVGIGGAGMSSLAAILLDQGEVVTGCDLTPNDQTRRLERRGARIYEGHDEAHVQGADRLVITAPVRSKPEVMRAREIGVPVVPRAEMLGELMDERRGVAISGTHGKTTTTSLVATMMISAELDPMVLVGGVPAGWEFGGRHGEGEWLVAEADEYDRSFLHLHPEVAVVTGIEMDHPDIYRSLEDVKRSFAGFLGGMSEGGKVLVYAGSRDAIEVARTAALGRGLRVETYGDVEGADWLPVVLERRERCTRFEVRHPSGVVTDLSMSLVGRHNLNNATAAVAAALAACASAEAVRSALEEFGGVGRRFELKGEAAGVTVVDDYAHHPTEVEAALQAARAAYNGRPIWAAFQPHTYSRTRELMGEFAAALSGADRAYVLDVYAAREQPEPGVTGERLAGLVGEQGVYAGPVAAASERIAADLVPGVVLLTLGAGDITTVGPRVLAGLEGRVAT